MHDAIIYFFTWRYGVDKNEHFIVGFILYCILRKKLSIKQSLMIVLMVGCGKEVYDAVGPVKGDVEFFDIMFTIWGGLFAYSLGQLKLSIKTRIQKIKRPTIIIN